MLDRRIDELVLERRADRALPVHRLLRQERSEEVELLLEELFVLAQVEAEEREGLGEGAAAEDDLGAPVRGGIDRREALEDADRIIRTQHGDGRAERMRLVRARHAGEHGLRRGDGEIGTVMLADADEIDADLIGQHGFLDEVADHLRMRQRLAVRASG